jgi:hypothetical protein
MVRSRFCSIMATAAIAFGAIALTAPVANAGKNFEERCFADGGVINSTYGSDGTIYRNCIVCHETTKTPRVCKIAYSDRDVPPSVDPKPAVVPPPVGAEQGPGAPIGPVPVGPNTGEG